MVIVLLLIFFAVLLIFSYQAAERDVMHPAVIFSAVYVLSIGCAVTNIARWNIRMSWLTFAVLAIGGAEFVLITLGITGLDLKQKTAAGRRRQWTIPVGWKPSQRVFHGLIVGICIYNVVAIGLMVQQILAIASQFGRYTSLSGALTLYKYHASYSIDARLPSYVTIMLKPVIAFGYVMLFLFLKQMVFEKGDCLQKLRSCWYYLLPVALYVVERLFESNRGAIIDLVASGVTMYFIFWSASKDWRRPVPLRALGRLFTIGAAGLLLFYFSAGLIGRINTKGLFEYITYYCGGSIECFNRYLQKPPVPSGIFGEETFYHLIVNLDAIGITDFRLEALESGHFEFQYYRNIMIGNVYTAYRRWIQDFGLFGAALLQGAMAALFGFLYRMIRRWPSRSYIWECITLLYAYLAYCIYLHPIDGYLYFEVISVASAAAMFMVFAVHAVVYWMQTERNSEKK